VLKLRAYRFNTRLPKPISISFHTWTHRENVLVSLELARGGEVVRGLGEASPFELITGDSQASVLEEAVGIRELPLDPGRDGVDALHRFMDGRVASPSLRAAVDYAYHDVAARLKDTALYRLYAERPRDVDNSVTVFLKDSPESAAAAAVAVFKEYEHLRVLKIKLAGGPDDLDRIRAIGAVSPEGIRFVLDANQGYVNGPAAVAGLKEICDVLGDVILVEEPCRRHDLEALRYVTQHLEGVMVFADESAATLEDVRRIVEAGAADGVNIKLQKSGGIWPSREIARVCADAGLKTMVGSMMESPIATAASVHFAVSTDELILSDLDMDLDTPDMTTGRPPFEKGRRIPEGPGLGLAVDWERVEALTKAGEMRIEQVV